MKLSKLLISVILVFLLSLAGFYLCLRPKYVVPILMYHHLDDRGKVSSLSVAADNFLNQMRFLSRRNYNVISLKEFVQGKRQGRRFKANTCLITFDDGYLDNYTLAYPILKKYNLPATIFVIVDKIGQQGYLNYRQIKEMLNSGIIDIGSHSLAGDYLPGRTESELKREITDSKQILESRLNSDIQFFCYPIGGFTAQIQKLIGQSGYLAACATNRGWQQTYLNNDILALKRIKVKDSYPNLFVFWAKLSGYYNFFRRVRKPH